MSKGTMLDKATDDLNLYIGGLFTLRRKSALEACNITHVLSVLRLPLERELFEGYTHHVIEVDDVEDENLLQYLPQTNRFIQEGLDSGGGVLVHCAMGKSRSATCVVAYLMKHYDLSPREALARLKQARPFVEPNPGFMRQLQIYHSLQSPEDLESVPEYQRWLYRREVELSRACGQAPETIRFEDEHSQDNKAGDLELRCKKCRKTLGTSRYFVEHGMDKSKSCAHYFLDPLSWMRSELEQSKLEGRLNCPKCNNNVGKYAWQGMKCSCGEWVVPAITLSKSRIDEHRMMHGTNSTAMGIRQPPRIGQQNL